MILVFYIKGNNLGMKYCKQCGHKLSTYGNNYYCCDKQEAVCSLCRINSCKKCNQRRQNIVQPSKCIQCRNRIYDEKGFKQPACDKQYCAKCLAKNFNSTFTKAINLSKNDQSLNQFSIKLPCGDSCHFLLLASFFNNFCIQCGKDYYQSLDLQLKHGVKLCYSCNSYFRDKYLKAITKCNICDRTIERESMAGILNQQGLTLCKSCYRESQMEENFLEKNKQLNESRKVAQQFSNKKSSHQRSCGNNQEFGKYPQVKINSFFQESKKESSFVQKWFHQSFQQRREQKSSHQSISQNIKSNKQDSFQTKISSQEAKEQKKLQKKESQVSPLRKIIQKVWIPDQQKDRQKIIQKQGVFQKQRQNSQEYLQQDEKIDIQLKVNQINGKQTLQATKKQEKGVEYSVTNKLINEEEEPNQNLKRQLGVSDRLVLKKFLSDETLVENLVLDVPIIDTQKFVKCNSCCIKLSIKLAYNIDARPQNKSKSSSVLCINSVEQSFISSKVKQATQNCRVCHFKIMESQKKDKLSMLEESLSTNDRSFRTNASQRSGMSDSRTSDFMRASYTSQRKNIDPSPNSYHISPYGLTGARLEDKTSMTRTNIQNPRFQSIRKTQIPLKPVQERIKLSTGAKQFYPNRISNPTPSKGINEKIKLTSKQYVPQKRASDKYLNDKCSICGINSQKVIHVLNGGRYCTECYLQKDRSFISDYRKSYY